MARKAGEFLGGIDRGSGGSVLVDTFGGSVNSAQEELLTQEELLRPIRERLERDYGAKRHKAARRLAFETHSDLGGILLELMQNAEDADAAQLTIRFRPEGLWVENNGKPFSDENLYSLCSLFASEKGLDRLGFFGVGFKAVLQLTETPYLVSGPFRCKLEKGMDPYPASRAEFPLVPSPDRTTFWLPWRERVSPDDVEECFLKKFHEIGQEGLLFLDYLQKVELEGSKRSSFWRAQRDVLEEEGNLRVLRVAMREGGRFSEWLRLDAFADLPEEVLDDFVEKHGFDEEERRRFSGGGRQRVSIAIKIEGGLPAIADGLAFAGLPTKEATGFKFHVCARFPTHLSREGLKDVREDPLGRWLLEQLAELARRLPPELKAAGWLKPSVWLIFPAEGEGKDGFKSIEEKLLATLREGSYVHDSSGNLRPAAEVFLAHRLELYGLLTSSDLQELSGILKADWVHPGLRTERARKVLKSVGVTEISAEDVVSWLERKSCEAGWAELRSSEWFQKLYRYLSSLRDTKLWERIRELHVVLTRQGELVKPAEALFPPEEGDSIAREFEGYVRELDGIVVADELAGGEARELLDGLGVRDFDWGLVVERLFEREYTEKKPTPEANRRHISFLKELTKGGKLASEKVRAIGMWYHILRDRTGSYVRPADAYLSHEFASRPDEKEALKSVEHFFKLAGGRPFVAPDYLEDDAAGKAGRGSLKESGGTEVVEEWREFLLKLGVSDYPRLEKFELEGKSWWEIKEEAEKRGFSCPRYTRPGLRLVDWDIDGLPQVMEYISKQPRLKDVKAIWSTMAWFYHRISNEKVVEYYENGSTLTWLRIRKVQYAKLFYFYRQQNYLERDATWIDVLRSKKWLLDQENQPVLPSEIFVHSLKDILGQEFRFLHPEIPLKGWHRDFAEDLLEIKIEAKLEDIIENLTDLRNRGEVEQKKILPIYEYLNNRWGYKWKIRELFSQEPLIFVPGQGWFRTGEVCWRDEVGILPALEPCWGESLRSFFLDYLGINEKPQPEQYAKWLICLGDFERLPDSGQIEKLYKKIWEAHRDGQLNPEIWAKLRESQCWLGQQGGGQLCWANVEELFLNDNKEIANLFEEKVIWWALPRLEKLAEYLEIEPISRAQPEFTQQVEVLGEEKEIASRLENVWCYLFTLLKEKKISHDPPKVLRVADIEVRYRIKDVVSKPQKLFSCYQQEENKLLVTGTSGLGMDEEVAEALRLAFRIEIVSELVKDLLRALGDPEALEAYLKKWCNRFGVEYSEIAEELAAAGSTSCGRVPKSCEAAVDGVVVLTETDGALPEGESEEVPGSMEEVISLTQGGQGELMEESRVVDQSEEATPVPQVERSLRHPVERGTEGVEEFRPGHREASVERWERDVGRGQSREPVEFTGRRLSPTEKLAEVEREAVDVAKKWLESLGYKVYEEAAYDVGYDLRCFRDDGRELWVEVKGRSGASPVSLSEKQWKRAKERGDSYWLVIVVVGEDETEHDTRGVFVIKDPAKFEFEMRKVTTVEYEAQPHQWKEWAEEVSLGGVE